MKHHSILSVETFTLEGTLFAPDILDRLFKGELDGDYPFSVPPGMGIADEYGRAFREDELSRFGERRTKRFALEAWERAEECAATGGGAQHSDTE